MAGKITGKEITIHVCGRPVKGFPQSQKCGQTSCSSGGVAACGYQLRGRKAGQACGVQVCTGHLPPKGPPRCPPHARLEAMAAAGARP
jgi:hypothetical protein